MDRTTNENGSPAREPLSGTAPSDSNPESTAQQIVAPTPAARSGRTCKHVTCRWLTECGQVEARRETEDEKMTRVILESEAQHQELLRAVTEDARKQREAQRRQELELQRRRGADERARQAEERARQAALDEAAREADPASCDLQRVEVVIPDASERPCGDRVREALTELEFLGLSEHLGKGRDGCGDRYSAPCPVCEGVFAFASGGRDHHRAIWARCMAGCDSETLARAIERFTVNTERRLAREADEREREEFEQEMSIVRAFEGVGDQRWLVQGIIPADGLVLLVGRPGAGKSFVGSDMAVCVAAGKPWLGREVAQSRTLLIMLEGGKGDRLARIGRLIAGIDLTLADINGKLDIWQLPLKTDDPESFRELARRVAKVDHKLIIIDNLTVARLGGSENDPGVMTAAMKPLAQMAQDREIGIVLLHHAGKDGSTRGTTAILGHTDQEIHVSRQNDKPTARITLSKGKSRYVGAFEDEIVFRYPVGEKVVAELVDLRPEVEDEQVGDSNGRRQGMLDLLGGDGLAPEPLYAAMSKRFKAGRKATLALRNELHDEGAIVLRDGIWMRSA